MSRLVTARTTKPVYCHFKDFFSVQRTLEQEYVLSDLKANGYPCSPAVEEGP